MILVLHSQDEDGRLGNCKIVETVTFTGLRVMQFRLQSNAYLQVLRMASQVQTKETTNNGNTLTSVVCCLTMATRSAFVNCYPDALSKCPSKNKNTLVDIYQQRKAKFGHITRATILTRTPRYSYFQRVEIHGPLFGIRYVRVRRRNHMYNKVKALNETTQQQIHPGVLHYRPGPSAGNTSMIWKELNWESPPRSCSTKFHISNTFFEKRGIKGPCTDT